jgi:hypothetical protein
LKSKDCGNAPLPLSGPHDLFAVGIFLSTTFLIPALAA